MIIYTEHCLACTNKKLWRKIKAFCSEHNLSLTERRVTKNRIWHDEAMKYEIDLPFAVHGGTALSLTEELERIL